MAVLVLFAISVLAGALIGRWPAVALALPAGVAAAALERTEGPAEAIGLGVATVAAAGLAAGVALRRAARGR